MRMASTLDDSHYTDYGAWGSAAGFVSTDKISLLHNWEIRFSGQGGEGGSQGAAAEACDGGGCGPAALR